MVSRNYRGVMKGILIVLPRGMVANGELRYQSQNYSLVAR